MPAPEYPECLRRLIDSGFSGERVSLFEAIDPENPVAVMKARGADFRTGRRNPS